MLGFCALQGGGLAIFSNATLTNTNIYSNTASQVCAHLSNLTRRFLPSPRIEPTRVTFHHPTELTLELTDCCVHVLTTSASQLVSACILNFHRRFFHRPDGTLRAGFFGLQGGGVYVLGVANFESCNIHDNTATNVCLHL